MCDCSTFFVYSPSDSKESHEKGYILLHPTRPEWIAVNRTTLEIASCLDRGQSMEETTGYLAAHYGIPVESAKKDVIYVAEELTKQHFLLANSKDPPVRSPALDSVYFHITTRCNLSCLHCYIGCPANGDLPGSLIMHTIDDLKKNQCAGVTLSGGEPLLHPEIRTILEYSASKVRLRLLTNGTLIDRDWAAFLAQTVSAIQISVDSSTSEIHDTIRGKGSFRAAVRALEYLQDAGLAERITLSATIMKQNLEDLPGIIALAERLGVPTVRFLPLRKSGRALEQWNRVGSEFIVEHSEKFYEYVFGLQGGMRCSVDISCGLSGFLLKLSEDDSKDECWCSVGKKLVVDVHGDIYPCVLLMGDEFRLGNARYHSLAEVVRSEHMVELCNILVARKTKITKCSTCHWQNLCQGGCMGQALDHHGTIWETDLFCDYRMKAYRNAFDRILQTF